MNHSNVAFQITQASPFSCHSRDKELFKISQHTLIGRNLIGHHQSICRYQQAASLLLAHIQFYFLLIEVTFPFFVFLSREPPQHIIILYILYTLLYFGPVDICLRKCLKYVTKIPNYWCHFVFCEAPILRM